MFPYGVKEDPEEFLFTDVGTSASNTPSCSSILAEENGGAGLNTISSMDNGSRIITFQFTNGSRWCAPSFKTQLIVWKVVAAFMGFFFLSATLVQYNDPDPYFWVPAYIVPCLISWAVSMGLTLKKLKTKHGVKSGNHQMKSSDNKIESVTVDAKVMIPMYGNANRRLDCLINFHILFCFGLGLWTLALHVYNFRHYYGHKLFDIGSNPEEVDENHITKLMSPAENLEEAKEVLGLCLVIAWLSLVRRNNYVLLGKVGLSIAISLTLIPIISWVLVEVYQEKTKCQM